MARSRRRVLLGLAGGALGALLVAAALLAGGPAAARSGLREARVRWAGQRLAAYELQISQRTRDGDCAQQMRASGERAAEPISNSCGQPATWTVTRLFNWIEQLEQSPVRCYPGPAYCACQITLLTRVSYDQALGYPRAISYEWRMAPNLLSGAYWRSLGDRSFPGCRERGTGGLVNLDITLSPTP